MKKLRLNFNIILNSASERFISKLVATFAKADDKLFMMIHY